MEGRLRNRPKIRAVLKICQKKLSLLTPRPPAKTGNIEHFQRDVEKTRNLWKEHEFLWRKHGACENWINYSKKRYHLQNYIKELERADNMILPDL